MEILGFVLIILGLLVVFMLTGLKGKALQDFVDRVTKNKDKNNKI